MRYSNELHRSSCHEARFPIRAGLVAAGLATFLSPLLLVGEAALLYGCGIVTPRRHFLGEDNAHTFAVFGTLILAIPELVWGLVFGGAFAAIGKGRHLAGAISGSILWSVVPLLYAAADAAGYAQVTSPVGATRTRLEARVFRKPDRLAVGMGREGNVRRTRHRLRHSRHGGSPERGD
jgi:hypothetical protein